MDPDEALRLLREALDGDPDDNFYSYDHAVEAFQALDQWLTRGGYLPVGWQRHQPTSEWMRGRPTDEAMPAKLRALRDAVRDLAITASDSMHPEWGERALRALDDVIGPEQS